MNKIQKTLTGIVMALAIAGCGKEAPDRQLEYSAAKPITGFMSTYDTSYNFGGNRIYLYDVTGDGKPDIEIRTGDVPGGHQISLRKGSLPWRVVEKLDDIDSLRHEITGLPRNYNGR